MQTSKHIVRSEDELKKLRDLLDEKVFHVTLCSNWKSIQKYNCINSDCRGEKTFGSSDNSFFKKNKHVSMFDFRNSKSENFIKNIHKCDPFSPLSQGNINCLILCILDKEYWPELLTWDACKSDWKSEMIVPHVEAGFPDPLDLRKIRHIIEIESQIAVDPIIEKLLSGRKLHSGNTEM